MTKRGFGVVALFTAAVILAAQPARATFHVIVIDQVFFGFPEAPHAQYVMLRIEAPVQSSVHAQPFPLFDASGTALAPFAAFCPQRSSCDLPRVSPACSAGGCPTTDTNNRRVLAATPWAAGLFCITP